MKNPSSTQFVQSVSYAKCNLLIVFLILAPAAIAQTSTDWKLSGNTVTSDSKLGTNTGYDLIIETNNLERMRVSSLGKVGIGTNTPSAELDVNGHFHLSGEIRLGMYQDAGAVEKRVTYIDQYGTLKKLEQDQLMELTTIKDCFYKTGELYPSPIWQSASGSTAGLLFTGATCPAYVGIGTSNPITEFEVYGNAHLTSSLVVGSWNQNSANRRIVVGDENHVQFVLTSLGEMEIGFTGGEYEFPFRIRYTNDGSDLFRITSQGGIEIAYHPVYNNANPPVAVVNDVFTVRDASGADEIVSIQSDGKIYCQGLIVRYPPFWPDYVFHKEYPLMPLGQVEEYINTHQHLPGMPSEVEVMENGISMDEMIRLLTEKVEELTLYTILQQKEIEALKIALDSK